MSVQQTEQVIRIIEGDIGYLAGPGKQIAIAMPCTVIRKGDAADQFLTPELHPDYQGFRAKMLYSLPTNEKFWTEYETILREDLQIGAGRERSTNFYVERRAPMDEGAKAGWDYLFDEDEASAIQHAMNLKFRDEEAFWAEAQNEPKDPRQEAAPTVTADQVASKTNGFPRGAVPLEAIHVTAFVDVHDNVLYWMVSGWTGDFSGAIVDYGTYPDQGRAYYSQRSIQRTLISVAPPGTGIDGAVYAGLEKVTELILAREWQRADGVGVRVERCMVDSGFKSDLVYQFCRQNVHAAVLRASKGQGVTAAMRPMAEQHLQPGERRVGYNAREVPLPGGRGIRYILFDTNYWKTFVNDRLATAKGDKGCLTIFGQGASEHRLLAEHLTAEFRTPTAGHGRNVDAWKLKPGATENHFLDDLVGCAVGASTLGVVLPTQAPTRIVGKRRTKSLAEMAQR